MGWNCWNTFGCDATEQIVKDTADFMASSGMRDAGYQYLTIDDCWMERSRDSEGRLVPEAAKYPHGLAELAAYVHGKGLKFGVYESPTYHTCQGFPGSLAWGVDFLRYDNCTAGDPDQRPGDERLPLETRDSTMRDALGRTGRPIVFSLSLQPAAQGESPWEWGKSVANMWRIDGDRDASFDGLKRLIHTDLDKAKWAGPGRPLAIAPPFRPAAPCSTGEPADPRPWARRMSRVCSPVTMSECAGGLPAGADAAGGQVPDRPARADLLIVAHPGAAVTVSERCPIGALAVGSDDVLAVE